MRKTSFQIISARRRSLRRTALPNGLQNSLFIEPAQGMELFGSPLFHEAVVGNTERYDRRFVSATGQEIPDGGTYATAHHAVFDGYRITETPSHLIQQGVVEGLAKRRS